MTIDMLPTEILVKILCKVKKADLLSNTKDFTPVLTVSRKWSECALSAIWRDVILKSAASIQRFSLAANTSSAALLVQSITVIIDSETCESAHFDGEWIYGDRGDEWVERNHEPEHFASQASVALGESLCELADTFGKLKSLKTFSLRVTNFCSGWRFRGFFLDRNILRKIVHCLPASLEDLELDTAGAERPAATVPTCRLCPDLRELFFRLRHIRLCLGMICPKLFLDTNAEAATATTGTPGANRVRQRCRLKSLLLNLITYDTASLCTTKDDQPQTISQAHEGLSFEARAEFAELAQSPQSIFKMGCFPALREVRIIDEAPWYYKAVCPAITDRHILANKSYVSPYFRFGANTVVLRVQDTTGRSHEYVCPRRRRGSQIEEPEWLETSDGFRFCKFFTETAVAKERAYTYRSRDVCEGLEEYSKGKHVESKWLQAKEKAGGWQFDPLVTEGVGSIKALQPNYVHKRNAGDDNNWPDSESHPDA